MKEISLGQSSKKKNGPQRGPHDDRSQKRSAPIVHEGRVGVHALLQPGK
jgi:hypothetical protein